MLRINDLIEEWLGKDSRQPVSSAQAKIFNILLQGPEFPSDYCPVSLHVFDQTQTHTLVCSVLLSCKLRRRILAALALTFAAACLQWGWIGKQTNTLKRTFLIFFQASVISLVFVLNRWNQRAIKWQTDLCEKPFAVVCLSSFCACGLSSSRGPRWPVSLGWKWHRVGTVGALLLRKRPPACACT